VRANVLEAKSNLEYELCNQKVSIPKRPGNCININAHTSMKVHG